MPPAAALECERTGWTLLMMPTVAPDQAAASAARCPARPAPMIRTSYEGMAGESIRGLLAEGVILGPSDGRLLLAPGQGARRRRPRGRPLSDPHAPRRGRAGGGLRGRGGRRPRGRGR